MAWAAGIGRYIRNLVPRLTALEPSWQWTLLGDLGRLRSASWARGENVRAAACHAPVYGIQEQVELPWRMPRSAQVFWAPHYNAPLLSRAPVAVTVHDMAHLRLPQFRRTVMRRAYARAMLGAVNRRAAAVMFVSRFTQTEMQALLGPTRGRTAVIHEGVDAAWGQRSDPTEEPPVANPYFVFVGDQKPHKNLPTLLQAFAALSRESDAGLVVIGRVTQYRQRDTTVDALIGGLGDRVVVTGELEDEVLRRYVRHAVALVQPSWYEGFGLPPLEAMAAGCPTIVSNAGALPEVCGDAALFFDPHDADTLAAHMRLVMRDPAVREDLRFRGRERARQFQWDVTAARTRDVLAEVAA